MTETLEQLEAMVQRDADRADGLQWRRALAAVAADELGIGLGEALAHPAVARAQAIVGAPSYEKSLAQLNADQRENGGEHTAKTAQRGKDGARGDQTVEPPDRTAEHTRADAATDAETADSPGSHPDARDNPADRYSKPDDATNAEDADEEATDEEDADGEAADHEDDEDQDDTEQRQQAGPFRSFRLPAIHLGGIANLAPADADLALRFSAEGVDIIRGRGQVALGRLTWAEISALQLPAQRGLLRRRRGTNADLVIRTEQGDASFEIPGVTTEQLEEQLEPARRRIGN